MRNMFHMYGMCREYVGSMEGVYKESVGNMYGICIEYVWNMNGIRRNMTGIRKEYVRNM